MPISTLCASLLLLSAILTLAPGGSAQSPQPYPNAVTDRLIHQETPMSPPPKNVVFTDPDFASSMVRVTDRSTNFRLPGTFLRSEGSGESNEWSKDTNKFYVVGAGGQILAFAFDPKTMIISSLPNAKPGQALLIPLRTGATFSFVDSDVIYGTSEPDTLTIRSYRFSAGVSTPIIDTRTCGVQPPLGTGPSVMSDDDMRSTLDDTRFSISEGGSQSGSHMFVVVYDKKLGCRWYNTQTGQIGGQWGNQGAASVTVPYLIRHAYLSRSGKYVVIYVNWFGWYVWDVSTLNVTACPIDSHGEECAGYKAVGYNSLIDGPAILGDMQVIKRPLRDISKITQLVTPVPFQWEDEQNFSWNNVNVHDSTPVCGTTHSYDGNPSIVEPFQGEVFCVETDGAASTVWRFAHNRALYVSPFFQTQPLGDVSQDGHFFMFTSTWDGLLGTGADGQPLSDVFIVKLD
jgi:hypothetical protein